MLSERQPPAVLATTPGAVRSGVRDGVTAWELAGGRVEGRL